MKNNTHARTRALQMNQRRRRLAIAIAVPLCTVVMVLALLLTLRSAATQESAHICGMTEHIHKGECYTQQFVCVLPEGSGKDAHTHGETCYTEEWELTCELPETEAGHTHDSACYTDELVCPLMEHAHDEECYAPEEPLFEPFEAADFGLFSLGSWDLTDFLDNFIVTETVGGALIYNYQSGGLQSGKSFVYGKDYDFRVEFSAPNSNFDFPTYNDGGGDLDGYMVFPLPDGMTISEPTMSGPLGTISGSYTIFTDSSNHSYVMIRFNGDLLDQFNGDGNPYGFWVAFTARFEKIGNGGKFEFGDDITITPDPDEPIVEKKLLMSKTNTGFKNSTDTVTYTVTLTAQDGAWHLTHLVDTLTFKNASVNDVYGKISGISITKGGSPFSAYTTAAGTNTNEWVVTFTGGGTTLNDGESLVLTYTFDCSSLINKGSNPLMWGNVNDVLSNECKAFDGSEQVGKAGSDTSLSFRLVKKAVWNNDGSRDGFELVNGVMYVHYYIEVGDGSRLLNGMTITDTIESGCEYAPARPNQYKLCSINWNTVTGGLITDFLPTNPTQKSFTVVVPSAGPDVYYVRIEYWVKVNDPGNWNPKNWVTIDDLGTYEHETGVGAFRGDIKKTGKFTGTTMKDAIEWEFKIFIPKELHDLGTWVLMEDKFEFGYGAIGRYFTLSPPTDMSQYTISYDPPMQAGVPNPEDLLRVHYSDPGNNYVQYVFDTPGSISPFEVDTWITVKFSTPLNTVVQDDKTLYDILSSMNNGFMYWVRNNASVIYSGLSGKIEDKVMLSWPIHKDVYGYGMTTANRITYRVQLDGSQNSDIFANGWVFTDTFDPRLRYVPGSFHVTDVTDGATYGWNYGYGDFDINGNYVDWVNCPGNVLTVDFEDLVNGSWGNTLGFWGGSMGGQPMVLEPNKKYTVFYTLELKDYHEEEVEVENTASMNGYYSSRSETIKQAPGIKTMEADAGNTITVEIIVNPLAELLGATGSEPPSFIAYDVMSANLELNPESIEIWRVLPENAELFPTRWTRVTTLSMSDAPLTLSDDLYTYYIESLQEISFHLPNETPIKISYKGTVINLSNTGEENVENTITLFGKGYCGKLNQFRINNHTGGSWLDRNEVTLFKRDSETNELLDGAHFALYVRLPNDKQPPITAPSGIAQSILDTGSGYTFWYIQDAVTVNGKIVFHRWLYPNANPPPIYMLVELTPPPDYVADDPVTFFAFKALPGPEAAALTGRKFVHITDGTITVTNTYTDEKSVTVTLNALKNTLGEPMEAEQFTFALYEIDETGEILRGVPNIRTAENEDAGMSSHVHFGTLTFTAPGTYVYYLSEEGSEAGWAMDTTCYRIEIVVELDTQSNELIATVYISEADANGIALFTLRLYEEETLTLWPSFLNSFGGPRLPDTGSTGSGLFIAIGIAGICLMGSLSMYIKRRNEKMILQ